jgi:hypothetical protein
MCLADLGDYPFEDDYISKGHIGIYAATDCEVLAVAMPCLQKKKKKTAIPP